MIVERGEIHTRKIDFESPHADRAIDVGFVPLPCSDCPYFCAILIA